MEARGGGAGREVHPGSRLARRAIARQVISRAELPDVAGPVGAAAKQAAGRVECSCLLCQVCEGKRTVAKGAETLPQARTGRVHGSATGKRKRISRESSCVSHLHSQGTASKVVWQCESLIAAFQGEPGRGEVVRVEHKIFGFFLIGRPGFKNLHLGLIFASLFISKRKNFLAAKRDAGLPEGQ